MANEDDAVGTGPHRALGASYALACILESFNKQTLKQTGQIPQSNDSYMITVNFERICGSNSTTLAGCMPSPGRRARMDPKRMALLRVPQQHSAFCK